MLWLVLMYDSAQVVIYNVLNSSSLATFYVLADMTPLAPADASTPVTSIYVSNPDAFSSGVSRTPAP